MNDEHILRIKEPLERDESIRRYEYNEYLPITGTSLNTNGEIRIIIESTDEFLNPSQSFIQIEGQLVKSTAGAAYGDGDNITLVNNGPMFLFSNIKYEMSGYEVESINYPGPASTMKGLLKYSPNYAEGQGMNHCWMKDTTNEANITTNNGFKMRQSYIIKSPNPKGNFNFCIPLHHVFGYADDYDKISYGLRHILTLNRQGDNDAIFRAGTVDAGKIVISKISWMMPRVLPNDKEKLKLIKLIESEESIQAGFRAHHCDTISVPEAQTFSWKLNVRTSPECPRWVIVAFQTNRSDQQDKNSATFDHCNAQEVWIELNGDAYPSMQYHTDFTKMQMAGIYNAIADFIPNYYGFTNGQPTISPLNFKTLYPLHVINLTKQPEGIKRGVMDMNLRAKFRQNVPANTQAFVLVISDRILTFPGYGNKMNVKR